MICQAEVTFQRPGEQCQFQARTNPYKVGKMWLYLCGIHAYHAKVLSQDYQRYKGVLV